MAIKHGQIHLNVNRPLRKLYLALSNVLECKLYDAAINMIKFAWGIKL